jgi:5'-nucleotidase / UDP-sugar diphosphatase
MSDLGCRAMALGNREFELSAGALHRKARLARFPLVCTNMVSPPDVACRVRREVLLATPSGRRVRVLGALRNMVEGALAERLSPFRFLDPLEAVSEQAALAGSGELVVLLSHLGERADLELLRRVPRLDVILGGHDHRAWLHREGRRVAVSNPWAVERSVTCLRIDLERMLPSIATELTLT